MTVFWCSPFRVNQHYAQKISENFSDDVCLQMKDAHLWQIPSVMLSITTMLLCQCLKYQVITQYGIAKIKTKQKVVSSTILNDQSPAGKKIDK